MKHLAWSTVLLCSAFADARDVPHATASQLNTKHHLLRVAPFELGGDPLAAPAEPLSIAVGGTATLAVPSNLGVGHGPFARVYDAHATPTLKAGDALAIAPTADGFAVTCKRAGTFELQAAADHIDDSIDVTCVTPARFVATDTAGKTARYLVGASELSFALEWYGRRDGHEVRLLGTVPVEIAPGETAIAAILPTSDTATFRVVKAAASVSLVSAGITIEVPVELVDSHGWKLELERRHTTTFARAIDADGTPFAGLEQCTLTTYQHAVPAAPRTSCSVPRSERYDRVCIAVLGQTACR